MPGVEQFLAHVAAFGPNLEKNEQATLGEVGLAVKTSIVAAAAAQWGSFARGAWVKYTVMPGAVEIRLRGGRAHMAQKGARPHNVGDGSRRRGGKVTISRKQAARNAAGPRVLSNGEGGGFFAVGVVKHPGFSGRPFFWQGVTAAEPAVVRLTRFGLTKTLADTFGH